MAPDCFGNVSDEVPVTTEYVPAGHRLQTLNPVHNLRQRPSNHIPSSRTKSEQISIRRRSRASRLHVAEQTTLRSPDEFEYEPCGHDVHELSPAIKHQDSNPTLGPLTPSLLHLKTLEIEETFKCQP